MITCELNGKKYSVDAITGRALREIGPAADVYSKLLNMANAPDNTDDEPMSIQDMLDTMVQWFCLLFQNKFTPDEVYDYYPVDRLMPDIALALVAVQNATTKVLSTFPTKPTATNTPKRTPKKG